MDKSSGMTLIEILIAMVLAGCIGLAMFSLLVSLQKNVREISLTCERNENLRLTPLILCQTVQSAGCGRSFRKTGIEIHLDRLVIRSDIQGPEGFPDGTLNQSYENLQIRLQDSILRMQSGRGRFQPLALFVDHFFVSHPRPAELEFNIVGEKRSVFNTENDNSIFFKLYLWNFCHNLFEQEREL